MRAAAVVKHKGPKRSGSIITETDESGAFTKAKEITGKNKVAPTADVGLTYRSERVDRSYYEHSAKRTAELYKKHKQAILARNRSIYWLVGGQFCPAGMCQIYLIKEDRHLDH